MNQQPKLLNDSDLARWLRVPVKWVREEADAGRLPCVPAGNTHLFDPKLVETVLAKRAREGANQ